MTTIDPGDRREPDAGTPKIETVLESVDTQVCLRGLLAQVDVTQVYRNEEDRDIEAVYVFPMPKDAVLMDLSLELNGKTLKAEVCEKPDAQEKYEDAIEDGDSAILLEELEPGLFALNAGNVRPGERAVVRFQYAQLHRWQGNELRLHVPTTLAPRYGDSGLPPHQVPEYTLLQGAEFSLAFRIEGPLAQAAFECPSHEIEEVSKGDGTRELSLPKGRAEMDRDVVLVLQKPDGLSACGTWAHELSAAGQEDYVSLVSFHPTVGQGMSGMQRCVTLVVDCSGSMGGDSMAQAKQALEEILGILTPNDYFNLIRFGNDPNPLFQQPVAASARNLKRAENVVRKMDANMGGTEIRRALEEAYRSPGSEGLEQDILLITDGEIWDRDGKVRQGAHASGCRFFTVGVGSAASEAFLRDLSEQTGGACEMVSPREDMARRIVRQFRRMGQLCMESIAIEWPDGQVRQHPGNIEKMFLGDTLHVWGWFRQPPSGPVKLSMKFGDGQVAVQTVDLWLGPEESGAGLDCLPRMALHDQLPGMVPEEALRQAMRYRLVTDQTSYVLVYERAKGQKATGHPELRQVPHTLAAGWGGMGSVNLCSDVGSLAQARADVVGHRVEIAATRPSKTDGFRQLVLALNARVGREIKGLPQTVSGLEALGLMHEAAYELERLLDKGVQEKDLVIAFLAFLSLGYKEKKLKAPLKKAIWSAYRGIALPAEVAALMAGIIDSSLRPYTGYGNNPDAAKSGSSISLWRQSSRY